MQIYCVFFVCDCKKLFDWVFASTYHLLDTSIRSAYQVYGSAQVPITEETPTGTGITNPYGRTKYFIEEILSVMHCLSPAFLCLV